MIKTSLALACLCTSLSAQSFNVDCTDLSGVPDPGFAAVGLAGTWNPAFPLQETPLLGLDGAPTSATIEIGINVFIDTFTFDNPGTTGNDERLLDDCYDPSEGGEATLQFRGLQPGLYTAITYAWAPDNAGFATQVIVSASPDPPQVVGGPWTGDYQEGGQYARHTQALVGSDGRLSIRVESWEGFMSLNGAQLILECPPPVNYCTGTPNSAGPGAQIQLNGSSSISANDFQLQTSGLPAFKPGIFYYGPEAIDQPFGNGRRCVGGSNFRLPVIQSDALGFAFYDLDYANPPAPSGEIQAGQTWNFQFWYRDPAAGGAAFNLSDAFTATFCP